MWPRECAREKFSFCFKIWVDQFQGQIGAQFRSKPRVRRPFLFPLKHLGQKLKLKKEISQNLTSAQLSTFASSLACTGLRDRPISSNASICHCSSIKDRLASGAPMSKGRNFLSAWLGLKKPSIPDKSFTSALYQLMRVDASTVVQFGRVLNLRG